MEMLDDQQNAPDVPAEQRESNELIKRIRKLRWMGMREEAETVQMQLALRHTRPGDSVLATPPDTD
jgi:hypothetical protein